MASTGHVRGACDGDGTANLVQDLESDAEAIPWLGCGVASSATAAAAEANTNARAALAPGGARAPQHSGLSPSEAGSEPFGALTSGLPTRSDSALGMELLGRGRALTEARATAFDRCAGGKHGGSPGGGGRPALGADVERGLTPHPPTPADLEDAGDLGIDLEPPLAVRVAPRAPITYEQAVWFGYLLFTGLAVADRFGWNVWPRQSFNAVYMGRGSAGSDRLSGYKPGPWTVVLYDVVARVSGRISIVAYNLLLLVRLRSLQWMLTQHPRVAPAVARLVDTTDIVNANLRLHRWNGVALVILTLVHVWSILLPCAVDNYRVQVVAGMFEWPLSERKPPGFKDVDADKALVSMQVDDVWRLVSMSVFLGVLMPISVRWLAKKWHAGILLHNFISVFYFVDIVRRHTHPHSWVLNTPVFILYVLDHFWLIRARHCRPAEVHRELLGEDYMALYWRSAAKPLANSAGPDYYLKCSDAHWLERGHPFTCFENSCGVPLPLKAGSSDGGGWSAGAVVRVFRSRRRPALSARERVSHTQRMYEQEVPRLDTWGPYQGEMSERVADALRQANVYTPVVLVCAGSGINYAIDALQKFGAHVDFTVLFTTRDEQLFLWAQRTARSILVEGSRARVTMALTGCDIVRLGNSAAKGAPGAMGKSASSTASAFTPTPPPSDEATGLLSAASAKSAWQLGVKKITSYRRLSMVAFNSHSLTSKPRSSAVPLTGSLAEEQDPVVGAAKAAIQSAHMDPQAAAALALRGRLERRGTFAHLGRLDLHENIPERARVFVQGSEALKAKVLDVCKAKGCTFESGNGGYA